MAFFLRRIRDHAEAEDLTQEVFIRMLDSARTGEVPDGYVFQIAANLLVDRARRAKVRSSYAEMMSSNAERGVELIDPDRIASGRADLAKFMEALGAMPERQRTMFVLYRLENMSQEMIGEAFGISASAVKKQIAAAMVFLTARMGDA